MNDYRSIVVDTNILLRSVFGNGTDQLFDRYGESIVFCTPDTCFAEAERYIPVIAQRRGMTPSLSMLALERLVDSLETIGAASYRKFEETARRRIAARDPNDWPILATALLIDCPLWTEDQDFFGTGVATWTTNNVEIYLSQFE